MNDQTTPPPRESLPRLIISGMPPVVRAVFFSVLAIPLVISISAILMQVNLGSILTKIIDNKLEAQTQEMQAEYVRQMQEIRIALDEALTKQDLTPLANRVDAVEERVAKAERALAQVDKRGQAHLKWSCDLAAPNNRRIVCEGSRND